MEAIPAVFEGGTIKPLGDVKIREKEKLLLAVIKLSRAKITEKTYGAVKIKNHNAVEEIIEDTKYGGL